MSQKVCCPEWQEEGMGNEYLASLGLLFNPKRCQKKNGAGKIKIPSGFAAAWRISGAVN